MTATVLREAAGTRHESLLRGFCRSAIWADQFVRTTYFGLTTTHLLLGAAVARAPLSAATLTGLVLLAACFHVHVFLINDVIDLPVDATQPRRANHPLVRGLRGEGVSKRTALAVAWLAAALAAGVTYWLGAGREAWAALGIGLVLIDVYNVWGKRFPVPLVTDAIQGLGWWGLVLCGVYIADPHTPIAVIADRIPPLLAFSMGFTLLITGVHGGLRDLVNDGRHGRINNSLFLGARPAGSSRSGLSTDGTAVESSWPLVVFAYAVLASMFSPAIGFVRDATHFASAERQQAAAIAISLLFAANCALLWKVVKPIEPRRDAWMSGHSVFLLAPPVVLYLLSDLPSTRMMWLVALLFAGPLCFQARFMDRAAAALERLPHFSQAARTQTMSPRPPARGRQRGPADE